MPHSCLSRPSKILETLYRKYPEFDRYYCHKTWQHRSRVPYEVRYYTAFYRELGEADFNVVFTHQIIVQLLAHFGLL